MLIELITIFTFWVINLEINPTITNIWLRPDYKGNINFYPINILNLLIEPFKKVWLWSPLYWDINFYTFFIICYVSYNYVIEFWKIHTYLNQKEHIIEIY